MVKGSISECYNFGQFNNDYEVVMPGSQLYQCDFHIHTPTSLCYKDKTATPEAIVQAAVGKGLNAIAITDHNSHDGIQRVIEAARGTDLVIFPGFELTARGGHILAIFDPETDLRQLDDALTSCGIRKEMRGREQAIGVWFDEALKIIVKDFNGLAIAAHAEGEKGFLKTIDQGQLRIEIYKDEYLSAIELVDLVHLSKHLDRREKNYERVMSCIQGSDAHRVEDIGSRSTLIKMQHLTLQGLRLAFNSPTSRISFPSTRKEVHYPYIRGINIDRGFLANQPLEFNKNFNCLLGGTGSGKSTVIEFLRFAFDQMSEDEAVREDTLGKLMDLAGIGATVSVSFIDRDGEEYLLSRTFDGYENQTRIRTRNSINPLDINIKDRFPIHAYSQGEALSIARNRKAQLDLIDKHITLELRKYQHEIENAYSVLDSQIEGLTRLDALIRDRSSYQNDLDSYSEQTELLNGELNKIKELQASLAVTSHQLWIEEKTYFQGLINSIDRTKRSTKSSFENIDFPILDIPFPEKRTPNKDVLKKCKDIASEVSELKKAATDLIMKGIDDLEKRIRSEAAAWKLEFEKHNKEYEEITAGHGGLKTKELNDKIEHYGKMRFDAQAKLKSIELAEEQYKRLLKTRNENIAKIKDQRSRIATLRSKKVKEITKTLPRLRIVLKPNAHRDEYRDFLMEAISMKGSHQKQPHIETISNLVDPFSLAELVRNNDYEQLEKQTKIGSSWASKVIEQLRAVPSTSYQLESIRTEDHFEISLDIGGGNFRALDKLSTGQKATVIVSLSLVEGSSPILFDQPEDALYSPFIVENIVQLVKSYKDKRQFIFATHNPNIAVGSDLDLGIVLEGSSSETVIKAAGGMDDFETNRLVVLYLEGGEQAVRERLKEYGF
jgi:ABC-type lipoprotein export system ATPase subunit